MKRIQDMIAQADMVLLGFGDEFTERRASREDVIRAYNRVEEIIHGKPWFAVTVNTDDLIYESKLNEFFIVAPCGSEKNGNVVTMENYDESVYLPKWQFYMNWLTSTIGKKLLILELGVGLAYPSVIRMPFERTVQFNQKATFIRIHSKLAMTDSEIAARSYCVNAEPIAFLLGKV